MNVFLKIKVSASHKCTLLDSYLDLDAYFFNKVTVDDANIKWPLYRILRASVTSLSHGRVAC